jgi:hypothetical protein
MSNIALRHRGERFADRCLKRLESAKIVFTTATYTPTNAIQSVEDRGQAIDGEAFEICPPNAEEIGGDEAG